MTAPAENQMTMDVPPDIPSLHVALDLLAASMANVRPRSSRHSPHGCGSPGRFGLLFPQVVEVDRFGRWRGRRVLVARVTWRCHHAGRGAASTRAASCCCGVVG